MLAVKDATCSRVRSGAASDCRALGGAATRRRERRHFAAHRGRGGGTLPRPFGSGGARSRHPIRVARVAGRRGGARTEWNGADAVDRAKLVREIRGWTLTILAVLAFRIFLYEAVYIPSGSMIPTLQIGDYVIVEKWAYGARIPFTPTAQATWRNPRRGDIVVLLAPPGNPRDDDLIKRVVGTEGDVVGIRDGHLVINGEPVPRERVPGTCTYEDKTEDGVWHVEPCADFVERLGTRVYHTYCTPHRPCGDVAPTKIPPRHVWVVGDHRDRSADSRVFGPVPVGRLKGRAWTALVSWGPRGPRWDRLFQFVNH